MMKIKVNTEIWIRKKNNKKSGWKVAGKKKKYKVYLGFVEKLII